MRAMWSGYSLGGRIWAWGVLSLCFMARATVAQEADNAWYLQGHLGAAFEQSADLHLPSVAVSGRNLDIRGEITFHSGWGGGLAAGRVWQNFRIEGEALWRRIGIDHVETEHHMGDPVRMALENAVERNLNISGNMKALAGLINVYYDFPIGARFRPYIGGGLGSVRATMRKQVRNLVPVPPERAAILTPAAQQEIARRGGLVIEEDEEEDRWGFCWQLAAGVGFELTESLTVGLGYRYLHVPSLDFHLFEGQRLLPNLPPATITVKPLHSVDLGLRWRF